MILAEMRRDFKEKSKANGEHLFSVIPGYLEDSG